LNEGPWGDRDDLDGKPSASGSGSGPEGGERPRPANPWSQNGGGEKRPRRFGGGGGGAQPSIEELIRRSRERLSGGFGGGGGGFNGRLGGKPIWAYALAGFVALWLITTSFHQIDPQERGVVTRFGRYVSTLKPGIGLTMPAPIDTVTRVNVDQISSFDVPGSGGQNLVLTGDQNIIDLAYSVRWSVRDPELFLFELADPEDTVSEIAESAMREQVSQVTLDQAIGPMRGQIEAKVAARIQNVLDRYHAGIAVQGVAIKQADPPAAVNDAFKEVSAAQQQAQSYLNNARAYAEQVEANAQAAAAAFDKVYQAYRLAPEVTRRRMYYETMEAVLAKTDKVIVDAPGTAPYMPLPLPLPARGAATMPGEPARQPQTQTQAQAPSQPQPQARQGAAQ
jgi:membrane protease subunit HflK